MCKANAYTAFVLGPSARRKKERTNECFDGQISEKGKNKVGRGLSMTKERGDKVERALLLAGLKRVVGDPSNFWHGT